MIPSTTNRLLVAEDWKKIYQSFRNAEFKSYDFETLRRTMVNYLRENYPEDFNDYIDSSEFVALIDLIAFLGQNLSFRIDLNARENFLETAERRESILRLARLINYNAKRNVPASGLLKIVSASTTENVIDSNGTNLANAIISWNDPTNSSWYQQFISIMNAAMASPTTFGKPYIKKTIDGIPTEQYRINTSSTDVPIYSFTKNVGGTQMSFELVSSSFQTENYIYEEAPLPGNQFGLIFKNDSKGTGSSNTGFFVLFKQGSLTTANFSVTNPVPNEVIGVNVNDINDTDVWLWQLSADSTVHNTLWTKVPAITGNNVIYNSLSQSERNIYGVITRENDQIDLTFADGSFGNLPSGSFKLYYRQSNGLSYNVKPEQLNNISIQLPYYSKSGQSQLLTLIVSLQYTVTNAATSETNTDIKTKAPQAYYSQNRMVTAEDYNIVPLTVDSDILKVKSVNRVSSGVSKYFELSDVSGKYSKTNIFADDGILYRDTKEYNFEFTFVSRNDAYAVIKNQLGPIVKSPEFRAFYIENYPRPDLTSDNLYWHRSSKGSNQTTGYFNFYNGLTYYPISLGSYGSGNLKYFEPGALIKFLPASDSQYYYPNGEQTWWRNSGAVQYVWRQIAGVTGDGSNSGAGNLDSGLGPVVITGGLDGDGTSAFGSVPVEIIPKFENVLSYALELEITNLILSKRNFGLSYDMSNRSWFIIVDSNIDLISDFSLHYQKDVTNVNKDASWMVAFEWTGKKYNVRYRVTEFIFESSSQTAFYIDSSKKNFDFVTNSIIKDNINVLSVNYNPGRYVNATAKISSVNTTTGAILSFDVTYSGHGYDSTPSITIDSVSGTSGDFIPVIGNGYVYSIGVVNGGSNYTVNDVVTISPPSPIRANVPIGQDLKWQIDSAIVEPDGYIEPKKVKVSWYDLNEDGQFDSPDAFDLIVAPDSYNETTGYKDKFVFFKKSSDGLRYSLVEQQYVGYVPTIVSYPTEDDVPLNARVDGALYYFYSPGLDVVKSYSEASGTFNFEPYYFAKPGRSGLKFQYVHNSGQERRIDPSKTNIIDVYLLTSTYDLEYRNWLSSGTGNEPLPPTTQSLEENYSAELEPIKSISDEIVYHPARYKVLFGSQATSALQATFKAVANPARPISTTDIQTRILEAINTFFAIENWDFGQTFNFGELATYVMNIMTPDITNFVIVPKSNSSFGNLYQITCMSDEIFVNGATVSDIEVITSLTATELKLASLVSSS